MIILGHAAVSIGDYVLMMSNARDEWKPMPSVIYLYVNDTDATYKRALQAVVHNGVCLGLFSL